MTKRHPAARIATWKAPRIGKGRMPAGFLCLSLLAITGGCSLAHDPDRAPRGAPVPALVMAPPVEQLGLSAREPMVVEHPDGTLFVAGYGEDVPTLWASRDQGATWTRVNVGTEAEGAIGNSDVDLAVAPNGTLYFATMVFDRKASEGTHISIGVSHDVGATWSWTLLSKTRFDDRPWVEIAADGTPHVIWNDGEGVCHAVSPDDGRTWIERDRIHPQGGSSHLAVSPNGDIAVRVIPVSASGNKIHPGVDLIAVSTDGGTTWQKHAAPGRREWVFPLSGEETLPRWVEPLAWDARGALYSLWSNEEGLWLARSADRGATWSSWRVMTSGDVMYFPYLVARGPGELAATWFSGPAATMHAHVARFDVGPG
ncbi:MAG TPA: sialidase family protein, partial [Solirubrobacterales bacterium]|nr:sialidase family protein [Solirubrobacterales bacterium]